MPNIEDARKNFSLQCLSDLKSLAVNYDLSPGISGECADELEQDWPQLEIAVAWLVDQIAEEKEAATALIELAFLCADDGGNLLEILRSHRVRADWIRNGVRAARALNDRQSEAAHLYNLGNLLVALNERDDALNCIGSALEIFRELGNIKNESAALNSLGIIHAHSNHFEDAVSNHQLALDIAVSIDSQHDIVVTKSFLASAYRQSGDLASALPLAKEAQSGYRQLGDDRRSTDLLIARARMYFSLEQKEESRRLLDEAILQLETLQLPIDGNLLHVRVAGLMLDLKHKETMQFIDRNLNKTRIAENTLAEGCLLQMKSLYFASIDKLETSLALCYEVVELFESIEFEGGLPGVEKQIANLTKKIAPS